jgi:DNA-binding transcriptional regulator LsrR (DeoR family)
MESSSVTEPTQSRESGQPGIHGADGTRGAEGTDPQRLYRAAQLYYEEGATQAQVAEHLQVSRPSISRMLSEARAQGIVEIRVHRPGSEDLDGLGEELRQRLGLKSVHLAAGDQSHQLGPGLAPQTRQALAAEGLRAGDVLLLASGETIYALAQQRLGTFPGVVVAPTVGGQAEPDPWHQTNEAVRAFTAASGGYPHYLFAPSMPSAALLKALQDDPGFRQIMDDWATAKVALMGIGAPALTRSSMAQSVPKDHPSLIRSVGDVCLAFFDQNGEEVAFPGKERMVRISGDTLRAVPSRIAVAVGAHKAPSIIAGAGADWFNVLITDETTARAVLASA